MKEDKKEYYKKYYENHKNEHRKRTKKWKDENIELIKEYNRKNQKDRYDILKLDPNCKENWKLQKKKLRKNRRDFIDNYKKDKCCSKCNEKRYYLLDFHHLNPKEKDFNLGDATKYSIKKLENELEKCVFLCSNCHREFHFLEKQNNLTIEEYLK